MAITFGVKTISQVPYGQMFTLQTDHKPLMTILGPKSAIPTLVAARTQRWALILSDVPESEPGNDVFLYSFVEELPYL